VRFVAPRLTSSPLREMRERRPARSGIWVQVRGCRPSSKGSFDPFRILPLLLADRFGRFPKEHSSGAFLRNSKLVLGTTSIGKTGEKREAGFLLISGSKVRILAHPPVV
jgi:hypothetical protein